jgi:putative membrane protein
VSDRQPPRRPRVIPEDEPVPVTPRPMPQAEPQAPPSGGPRVILDEQDTPAPRLDFQWEQAVVPVAAPRPSVRWSGIGRAIGGLMVLGGGLAALDAANFVMDQFGRGAVQGWATLSVVAGGVALLGSGLWREMRGLASIRAVDRARAAFARGDLAAAKAETLRWAASAQDVAPLQPAIRGVASIEELGALLQPALAQLEARAGALGRNAAVQSFAVTAISPSPGLDALVFAWRGVRLVRQVAALHGLRPGLAGTLALLRRTLQDAAMVAATDVAVDAAARALLSNRLLEQFAGEAAAGAVAARRMLRLARVAAEACRVLPPG